MLKYIVVFLFLTVFSCKVSAQGTFHEAYNEFKKQAEDTYENFRKKANKEYADWMRQAWEWHDRIEPMLMPKDDMMPPVIFDKKKEERKEQPSPLPYEEVIPVPEPNPQPKPIAPIREDKGEYEKISFDFFGTNGIVRLPRDFSFKIKGKDENAFANAWEELASGKYDNLIRDCLVLRMEYQLCDWAYLLMLGMMSDKLCGIGTNESVMLQGFVFCQSGYKIRFGITKKKELRVLFKSDHHIFGFEGYKMNDGIYYVLQPTGEDGLAICDISYPEEKPLSLWISTEQKFVQNDSEERLLIPKGSEQKIRVKTNVNWINFCATYPTSMIGEDIVSRWVMYANTPLAGNVKEYLYPQLRAAINQFENCVTATNWLLYWVQTAFVYEYDDKVWGKDRAFFAEETLYYPYCDCEDRSILFSRLVRDLLGLDVILVFYPGHLATAVDFKIPVNGDYIELNGKHFTICDPTYIGAPVGATMPDMDNQTAKVILLK